MKILKKEESSKPRGQDTESKTTEEPGRKITLNPKLKRRLQREESCIDEKTKCWKSRDANRTEMITKVCTAFDYVIDFNTNCAVKISSILAHLGDYEKEWVKFPKTTPTVATITADKLKKFVGTSNEIPGLMHPSKVFY